ncbi:hypothetical protein ACNOYE_15340 [Nannocystaceae bacterium ST9]
MAATGAAAPLLLGYRWWRRHRREQALWRELDETNGEPATLPDCLRPSLAAIAIETRRLRLELETPVRRVRAPLLAETPWARRQRCDEFDASLGQVRRAIWDWLGLLRRLGEDDQRLLGELGLSARPFRRLLFGCDRTDDPWDERLWTRAPDLDGTWVELRRTIRELERFELALTGSASSPYR